MIYFLGWSDCSLLTVQREAIPRQNRRVGQGESLQCYNATFCPKKEHFNGKLKVSLSKWHDDMIPSLKEGSFYLYERKYRLVAFLPRPNNCNAIDWTNSAKEEYLFPVNEMLISCFFCAIVGTKCKRCQFPRETLPCSDIAKHNNHVPVLKHNNAVYLKGKS